MKDDCTMCSWIKDKFFSGSNDGRQRANPRRRKELPDNFTAEDIRIESSICTGERTIGFYDPETKRLRYAELVLSDDDIASYYESYGLKYNVSIL